MTRTDPPDILVSTVHQDIKANHISAHSEFSLPPERCDFQTQGTLEDKQDKNNKRHCRSFDFIWSLDDPITHSSSMEYPYRKTDRHGAHPDFAWNALGQQVHLRFSSPDLLNTRLPTQMVGSDIAGEARAILDPRARSKSAPRVKTSLTPVPFEISPPVARRGRDVQRTPREPLRKLESSPRREASSTPNRALLNEVHPIKLQPQKGEARLSSPIYVSDHFEEIKPATTPHVRCRVDIKPDEAVLQHATRKSSTYRAEIPWQRYSSGGSRSLTVPRKFSGSRTPTPTDSFSGEYRQVFQYPNYMPNSYIQPLEIPLQRMPSPTDSRGYFGRERRAHSSPNVPTKLFYADDPRMYPSTPRNYYQEDPYGIPSQNFIPKVQYVRDPRTRVVHTAPARGYYTEIDPYQHPMYPKAYSTSEPGPYLIQTPSGQTYYGEDAKAYQIQSNPSKIFYTNEPFAPPPEQTIPLRAYHTEGRRGPRVPQSANDWYSTDISGYATVHPSAHASQFTPPRVRQEALLTPWYANPYMEPARLGADAKPFSKSWDNIFSPRLEREMPVQRGRSYENLLSQEKRTFSPDNRRQPVVVNLSSSPRRYAALSLSENSLLDRSPTESGKNPVSRFWYVTPEITITDNDLRGGNLNKTEVRSASWDILDSGNQTVEDTYQEPRSCSIDSTKEKTHNSSSLQQSLEQLDELLADLVIDYKPPASRRSSEDLLDQLKKLINENDATKDDPAKEDSKESDNSSPMNKQSASTKTTQNDLKDTDSNCDRLKKSAECSPEQSPDEDDTMVCSNSKCQRTETLFNACLYFKSCHSCYTYYCSRNCRREDWDVHKESCLYGRISSICRQILKHCRETPEVHKAFSRIAKVGYLSRGRGVLFLGFPNPGSSNNFLQYGLESLLMAPTYLSLRELGGFKDNLGEYCKELQEAGNEYNPSECFLLNVSIAVGEQVPDAPSPRVQAPTVRKYAKVSLASSSPEKTVPKKDGDMETLILTPPPGTADIDKEGEEGRKAREICFINIQRELRTRGVFLRHEYPTIYQQLCEFVESNRRFTPTTIYPIDKRTGKQFMCMIMAASEPRTLDWLGTPNLLDDII
ncbi:hypothetical protein Z043_115873 [Scleropages formosus]|uniref:Apical junction component 1 homolog n=1 Tax=Scleropages formosus TaxID=113540 RepID=A0A0P7WVJ6_SCLFO|nr:apical junction component 1 homolog [Scleropages formosus]KPP65695.1 hypothetical protein Z043_115873 [Scleropages formosus]